jgi:hypothetical protein
VAVIARLGDARLDQVKHRSELTLRVAEDQDRLEVLAIEGLERDCYDHAEALEAVGLRE